ncbi:hypothetical protein E8E11_001760 [Didymella keratinophila]|nr:hypothetical protein E8E11_001760 [Didymella keratinophila]
MSDTTQEPAQHSSARFFNNPALSEVKIRQIYERQVRKYYAHKVILAPSPPTSLTPSRESSSNVIELHDGHSEHSEHFLKSIYNKDDPLACKTPIDCFALKLLQALLIHTGKKNEADFLHAVVKAHYEHSTAAESKMGTMIVSQALKTHRQFFASSNCQELMREYHGFATDVAIGLPLSALTNIKPYTCAECGATIHLDYELLQKEDWPAFF